jgi:hypothetical protein
LVKVRKWAAIHKLIENVNELHQQLRGYLKSGMKAAPPAEQGVRHGGIEEAAEGAAADLAALG